MRRLGLLKTVVAEERQASCAFRRAPSIHCGRISEVGMDSLMAVELRLALETRLRIDLPLVSLAKGPA